VISPRPGVAVPPRARVAAACCALALALAACGSSHSGSGHSRTSTASSNAAASSAPTPAELAARLKLAKCVRAQGIDVPDPSVAGGPAGALARLTRNLIDRYGLRKFNAALAACQRYVAASFPRLAQTPAAIAQRQRQALKFARCMRAHGIDVPDPQSNGTGTGLIKALSGIDQNSPAFKSAAQACIGGAGS
jgi:hypothetical protein